MAKTTRSMLDLPETLKVMEWIKEHWEKRVVPERMSGRQVANAIASEKGIQRVTPANVRGVLKRVFPQWQLPKSTEFNNVVENALEKRSEKARAVTDDLANRLTTLVARVNELEDRVKHLEKEWGVKPLTSFLAPQQNKKS